MLNAPCSYWIFPPDVLLQCYVLAAPSSNVIHYNWGHGRLSAIWAHNIGLSPSTYFCTTNNGNAWLPGLPPNILFSLLHIYDRLDSTSCWHMQQGAHFPQNPWENTAPSVLKEVSVIKINAFEKSGNLKRGACVISCLITSNAASSSLLQIKVTLFNVSPVKGLAFFRKIRCVTPAISSETKNLPTFFDRCQS